jgi:TorA maturation chaperone TorD
MSFSQEPGQKMSEPAAEFSSPHSVISEEDAARADLYALAARLLIAPPEQDLLFDIAHSVTLGHDPFGGPFVQAWEALAAACSAFDADAAREEFDELFVGTGRPLLNPYGSFYLAGFMMEKPLAALREDLRALGLARRPRISETEDHLAALCETMRILIAGAGPLSPQPGAVQKAFFERHLAPWYGRCVADIRAAAPANFYRVVADFTCAFLDLEKEAFELEQEGEAQPAPVCC